MLPLVEYVCYLMYLNKKHDIDTLQKLQNRALRLCSNIVAPRTVSVCDLHSQASILPRDQRREKQLLGLMFDVSKKVEFVRPNRVHTRQANKIILDSDIHRCSIYSRSPYIIGCCLWNNLDANVQRIDHKLAYKAKIKDLYCQVQNPNT